ncbi:MAG: hypothetical protein ACRD0Z_05160 [Acidimicrobiales bacterium]
MLSKPRFTPARRVERLRQRARGRKVAHFIHVGKTAGTAIKAGLSHQSNSGRYYLMLHTHPLRLMDLPAGDAFFFCVRDPLSRYESGFRSRQRQGRPAHFVPWRPEEEAAFARYGSPDELGQALSAGGEEQRAAEHAMASIRHVNQSYWHWFGDEAYFRRQAPRLLWVGHQESLDVTCLATALELASIELPSDDSRAHRRFAEAAGSGVAGPSKDCPAVLSQAAVGNLRAWYAADYRFLEVVDEIAPGGNTPLP